MPWKQDSGDDLSPAELAFARNYAVTLNLTLAARAAGLTGKNLKRSGETMMLRPPVQHEISRLRASTREHHQSVMDWVVRELAAMAGANLKDVLSPDGRDVLPPSRIRREVMATLAEYQRTPGEHGDQVKVKQHDKLRAIQLLCRVFGLERSTLEHQILDGQGNALHTKQAELAVERAVLPPATDSDK